MARFRPTRTDRVIYRPEATGADAPIWSHVYTTWAEALAAAQEARRYGSVEIEGDASYSTHLDGYGLPSCPVPAGVHDMAGITFSGFMQPDLFNVGRPVTRARFDLLDGCHLDGFAGTTGKGSVVLTSDGPTGDVFRSPVLRFDAPNTILTNTDPGAGPAFVGQGFSLWLSTAPNAFGGVGGITLPDDPANANSPLPAAPVIDLNGGIMGIVAHAGSIQDQSVTDSVGGGAAIYRLAHGGNGWSVGETTNFQNDGVTDGGTVLHARSRDSVLAAVNLNPELTTRTPVLKYANLVEVTTLAAAVVVSLPPAGPIPGERVGVKDVGNLAGTNAISIDPRSTAWNRLNFSVNPLPGDTVTIGSKTYTFQAVLTDVDGNVQLGPDPLTSMNFLQAAVVLAPGFAGILYAASTVLNPEAFAFGVTGGRGLFGAKTIGSGGNAVATTAVLTDPNSGWMLSGGTMKYGYDQTWEDGTTTPEPIAADGGYREFVTSNGVWVRKF